MASYVITGALLPDGTSSDLFLADGVFVDSEPSGAERIDADGLVALPGLVDLHTHLREPGKENAETIATGTAAAAKGGFTTVFAMANLSPVTHDAENVGHILDIAAREASTRVVPVGSITRDLAGAELSDIAGMHATHGTVMFSDDGRCVMDSGLMRRAFEAVREFNGFLAQHSQDHGLAGPDAVAHESDISRELELGGWPAEAESIIVARDVQLAKLTGARLHVCHLSTAESVEIVRWAKSQGLRVTAEVTPHHLYLTTDRLRSLDPVFKVNPPLRTDEHVAAVREGLLDGTIDVVGTDHAPHSAHDKCRPFASAAFGMITIEQALAVIIDTFVHAGTMGWADVARVMSENPRRIGGLEQGPGLRVGDRADLVLIDPAARATVDPALGRSKSRNNPFAGIDLPDPVVATFCAGRATYRRD